MTPTDRLRQLGLKATPGPWRPWFIGDGGSCTPGGWSADLDDGTMPPRGLWRQGEEWLGEDDTTIYVADREPFTRRDAEFIAAARNHWDALLDEIAAARQALDMIFWLNLDPRFEEACKGAYAKRFDRVTPKEGNE